MARLAKRTARASAADEEPAKLGHLAKRIRHEGEDGSGEPVAVRANGQPHDDHQ